MTSYRVNYGAEHQSPGQWLWRSVGWTLSCLASTWVLNKLQYSKYMSDPNTHATKVAVVLAFGSCCVAHGLIWWLALNGSSAVFQRKRRNETFSWVALVAELWRGVLISFQVVCVLLLLLLLLVVLIVVGEMDIAPHFG